MTPAPTTPARKPAPEVRRAQRWNIVWVVPLIALLLGAWLLYRNFATQGPVVKIRFETAEEIYAEKTEVRCRSVRVGTVKRVKLADDLNSVVVHAELNPGLEGLLHTGTRFWVVKPRLSAAEISGLGTLIQGAYIELDPGPPGGAIQHAFKGLEKPPATNSSVPGLRVTLSAKQAAMLEIGAPVYHRGIEVGRIEERKLAEDGGSITYHAFIGEEFSYLVNRHTRFWSSSGVVVNTSPQGVSLQTPSLQAILSGGVSFGTPAGVDPGAPSTDGDVFTLYPDSESANHPDLNPSLRLLLLFDQSVLGLTTKSNVEFRGILIGRICRIAYDLVDDPADTRVPVLIEIDPSRIKRPNADGELPGDREFLAREIAKGLRAGLKTTSFITSAMDVDFDYYPEAPPATLGTAGTHTTFPTMASGLSHIESQLNAMLEKFKNLPIEPAIEAISQTAEEAKAMASSIRKVVDDPAFKGLPAELKTTLGKLEKAIDSLGPDGTIQGETVNTLGELREAIQSIKAVADMIEEKPNSLIFGRGKNDDEAAPEPRDSSYTPRRPHR